MTGTPNETGTELELTAIALIEAASNNDIVGATALLTGRGRDELIVLASHLSVYAVSYAAVGGVDLDGELDARRRTLLGEPGYGVA